MDWEEIVITWKRILLVMACGFPVACAADYAIYLLLGEVETVLSLAIGFTAYFAVLLFFDWMKP